MLANVRIQSECGKLQTRITPNTDPFHAVKFSSFKNHAENETERLVLDLF